MPVGYRSPRGKSRRIFAHLLRTLSLLLGLVALAGGCGSSPTAPDEARHPTGSGPTSVVVVPNQLTTPGGALGRFTAEVRDSEGRAISDSGVSWTTSDPAVAIVDNDGSVWTFAEGTATIIAELPANGVGVGQAHDRNESESRAETQVIVTMRSDQRPGRVTDLSVSGATETSLTLSFTEVDDGIGAPADYVVRWQEAPLDWGLATHVTSGTCSTPMRGDRVGAIRSCTVTGLAADTKYQFQLVAFRGIFASGMVHGALSNEASGNTVTSTAVEPDSMVRPDSSTQPTAPMPPVASGGSDGHPNEPAGLVAIGKRSFNQMFEGPWSDQSHNANYVVGVADDGAPSQAVGRARYPAGMDGGRSPIGTGTRLDFDGRSSVYVSFWLKFSAGWQGHSSGVNKVLYLTDATYGGGGDPIYVAAYGAGGSSLRLQVRLQGPDDETSATGGANLGANINDAELVRGRWHHVELFIVMNTETHFDGQVRGWLDGSQVIEYTDVRLVHDSAAAHLLDNVRWGPVWGGMGDRVSQDMFMFMDELYVSGTLD